MDNGTHYNCLHCGNIYEDEASDTKCPACGCVDVKCLGSRDWTRKPKLETVSLMAAAYGVGAEAFLGIPVQPEGGRIPLAQCRACTARGSCPFDYNPDVCHPANASTPDQPKKIRPKTNKSRAKRRY